jgi:hypothetical protein
MINVRLNGDEAELIITVDLSTWAKQLREDVQLATRTKEDADRKLRELALQFGEEELLAARRSLMTDAATERARLEAELAKASSKGAVFDASVEVVTK